MPDHYYLQSNSEDKAVPKDVECDGLCLNAVGETITLRQALNSPEVDQCMA